MRFSEGPEFSPNNHPPFLQQLIPPSLLFAQVLSPFMLEVQGKYLDTLYTPHPIPIEKTAQYLSQLSPRLPRGVMASCPLEMHRGNEIVQILQFKSDKIGDFNTAYLPVIHDFLLPYSSTYPASNVLPFEKSPLESAIILRQRSGHTSMSLLVPELQCRTLKRNAAHVIEQTGIWQSANAVLPTYLEAPPSALLGLMLWQANKLNTDSSKKLAPVAIKNAKLDGESFTMEAVVHNMDEPLVTTDKRSLQNITISGDISVSDAQFSFDGQRYVLIEALNSECHTKDPFQLKTPDNCLSDVVRSRYTKVYLNFILFPFSLSGQINSDEVAKLVNPLLEDTRARLQKENEN